MGRMDSADLLVRRMRLAAGLSQRGLASRAGTSQPALARYESGATTPSLPTLRRLAEACGRQLTLGAEPAPDPDDIELAEALLGLSPEERLHALRRYARLRNLVRVER
jgi:transcriptional regulator with XRE-family HTH domain